jgi:hypothetical protein
MKCGRWTSKVIRCNNGPQYLSAAIVTWSQKQGISAGGRGPPTGTMLVALVCRRHCMGTTQSRGVDFQRTGAAITRVRLVPIF